MPSFNASISEMTHFSSRRDGPNVGLRFFVHKRNIKRNFTIESWLALISSLLIRYEVHVSEIGVLHNEVELALGWAN
jgi:hypothetical protein